MKSTSFVSVFLAIILCLILSCSPNNQQPGPKKHFNEAFEKVNEIQLSTGKDHLIGRIGGFSIVPGGGYLVLSSSSKQQVFRFHQDGRFAGILGGNGKGPNEYINAMDITSDRHGNILLYDSYQRKIIQYLPDGSFLRSIKMNAYGHKFLQNSKSEFFFWRTDPQPSELTITRYDSLGNMTGMFAVVSKEYDRRLGMFGGGIVMDSEDNIYELERWEYAIKKFNARGELILIFGAPSSSYHPYKKPDAVMLNSGKGFVEYLRKISAIRNISMLKDKFIFVFLQQDSPIDGNKPYSWLDIYLKDGTPIASEVELPEEFEDYSVSEDSFYLLKSAKPDEDGDFRNPTIVHYRLKLK
ncbi:MAG: 6-bladed beta-propeller [bacterium]